MTYITVLNGVETIITKDQQMYDCIKQNGEIYSIDDDDGSRTLIANGKEGFLRGRPGFPVYPTHRKKTEDE